MSRVFASEPSRMPEIAEMVLSVALLVAMGLFLGGFALHQADEVIGQVVHAVA